MTTMHFQSSRRRTGDIRRRAALDGLSDATQWVRATLGEWRWRSRERGQLAALDDRMLRDIGLTRADAIRLSRKPFWQE